MFIVEISSFNKYLFYVFNLSTLAYFCKIQEEGIKKLTKQEHKRIKIFQRLNTLEISFPPTPPLLEVRIINDTIHPRAGFKGNRINVNFKAGDSLSSTQEELNDGDYNVLLLLKHIYSFIKLS